MRLLVGRGGQLDLVVVLPAVGCLDGERDDLETCLRAPLGRGLGGGRRERGR
jgi:hypothetical protein